MLRVATLFVASLVLFGMSWKAPLVFCVVIGLGFLVCLIHFVSEVRKNI